MVDDKARLRTAWENTAASILRRYATALCADGAGEIPDGVLCPEGFARDYLRDALRLLAMDREEEGRHLLRISAELAQMAMATRNYLFDPHVSRGIDHEMSALRGRAHCLEVLRWAKWVAGEGMDTATWREAASSYAEFVLRHRYDHYGPERHDAVERFVIGEDYAGALEWFARSQRELKRPAKVNTERGTGLDATLLRVCQAMVDGGGGLAKVRKAAALWYERSIGTDPGAWGLVFPSTFHWVYIWNRYFGGLTDPLDVLRDWRGF